MQFFSKQKKYKKYFKIKYVSSNMFYNIYNKKEKFGIFALVPYNLKLEHLTVIIKTLKRLIKFYDKKGKYLLKVFPDKEVTKKPKEIRMGRGKGAIAYKMSPVRAGREIITLNDLLETTNTYILRSVIKKLPHKPRITNFNR